VRGLTVADPRVHAAVDDAVLSIEDALAHAAAPEHGAAALFAGRVRNLNDGQAVTAVSYDVHRALCVRTFEAMAAEAQARWGDDLRVWLVHRQGRLAVGEASVVVAVSSGHREAAFAALRYLVEEMKRRAPVWKQEHYVDGDSAWLPGHTLVADAGGGGV
jgi:molybdopterin synthase catalytic subunit